jgi:hypothetical protein
VDTFDKEGKLALQHAVNCSHLKVAIALVSLVERGLIDSKDMSRLAMLAAWEGDVLALKRVHEQGGNLIQAGAECDTQRLAPCSFLQVMPIFFY